MANPRDPKPVLHTKKHIARLERERQQTRLILFAFIGILAVVIGLLVYGVVDVKYLQARRAIARVEGVPITIGEWQARVRMDRQRLINQELQYQQYAQAFGLDVTSYIQQIQLQLDSPESLGQSVLDRMIDEELVRQEAAKRGITVTKDEVDRAIRESYGFFPNGSPTPTITPTPVVLPTLSQQTLLLVTITPIPTRLPTFTPAPTSTPDLTSTPTTVPTIGPSATPFPSPMPFTEQGFQDTYAKSLDNLAKLGVSEEQIHRLYTGNLLQEKLTEVIAAAVPRVQDQVWARHILMADLASATTVRDRLLKGEDFAKVAAEVSTDSGTKDRGGDLGWFGPGVMVAEFEKAAFDLAVGQFSAPVQTQFGYHIIQVLAHAQIPLDPGAYDKARQKAFTDWLTKARTEYKVITFDNWIDLVPTDPGASSATSQ